MAGEPPTDKYSDIGDAWETAMAERQFKVAVKAAIDAYQQAEAEEK